MCHDSKGEINNVELLMTGFVWRMIMADYNVAWINTAEFRDSKVRRISPNIFAQLLIKVLY